MSRDRLSQAAACGARFGLDSRGPQARTSICFTMSESAMVEGIGEQAVLITNYCHPHCYANCSTKISQEHFISATLLRKLELTKIAGLAWQQPDTFDRIPVKGARLYGRYATGTRTKFG